MIGPASYVDIDNCAFERLHANATTVNAYIHLKGSSNKSNRISNSLIERIENDWCGIGILMERDSLNNPSNLQVDNTEMGGFSTALVLQGNGATNSANIFMTRSKLYDVTQGIRVLDGSNALISSSCLTECYINALEVDTSSSVQMKNVWLANNGLWTTSNEYAWHRDRGYIDSTGQIYVHGPNAVVSDINAFPNAFDTSTATRKVTVADGGAFRLNGCWWGSTSMPATDTVNWGPGGSLVCGNLLQSIPFMDNTCISIPWPKAPPTKTYMVTTATTITSPL